ncbi:MAG TPA: FAD-binding oxidoreductase [Candidatus Limnocylindrales bacterium]|nr:FAD-binding oxidoreductase [Candidatus Limnocylindrales bacterium]
MALARSLAPRPLPAQPVAAALREAFRGEIVLPGDPTYDTARRPWGDLHDGRPALVARPVDGHDVAAAVRLAADRGLELAVRSGGHSLAGHSTTEGGLLLDLRGLRGLHVDPVARSAWVGAGLTAGEVTRALHEHGLVVPFGDSPSVGVGGITLGGGIGWLSRKHGMTIDNLIAAELVTADGEVVTVSADRHPDLFWAIRGGGGNFGVVTRFQFRLQPVNLVLGGALALPLTADVLTGLAEAASEAPDELTTITMVMPIPPIPVVPPEAHGRLAVIVLPVYAGDLEAGQRAMAPLRSLAEPIADLVGPMPYPAMYELTGPEAGPHREIGWSALADDLPTGLAGEIVDRLSDPAAGGAMFQLRVFGGAMGRVPNEATAFGHRDRRLLLMPMRTVETDAALPAAAEWIGEMAALIRPVARGVYANFLGDEGEARVHEAYPEPTYRRLAALKRRYDPTNLFRRNQNIRVD